MHAQNSEYIRQKNILKKSKIKNTKS